MKVDSGSVRELCSTVQMAHTEGVGRLILGMPVEDKRKFFKAAFKSITLDGYGRTLWRHRSLKAYELSDALNTFILQHALGMCVPKSTYRPTCVDPGRRVRRAGTGIYAHPEGGQGAPTGSAFTNLSL